MKAYIAAGWFSPEQRERLDEILHECKMADIEVYSPKDELLFEEGKDLSPAKVFDANVNNIKECDFVIASTEGKDMGTLFECGYAYKCNKPIVYYFVSKGKFNLMLAESATAVCDCKERLKVYLKNVTGLNRVPYMPYKGKIE